MMTTQEIINATEMLPLEEQQRVLSVLENKIRRQKQQQPQVNGNRDEEMRHRRMGWLKANRERYGGQYVALDGDRLVGTGKIYREAAEAAKRAGVENAFVDYVRPINYIPETGGW
jgi:hypothetical protein